MDDADSQAGWFHFERRLKSEARYFSRTAEQTLRSIFEGIAEHKTEKGRPIIVEAGAGKGGLLALPRPGLSVAREARRGLEAARQGGRSAAALGRHEWTHERSGHSSVLRSDRSVRRSRGLARFHGGVGLVGMRERVRTFGGHLDLDSDPDICRETFTDREKAFRQ